MADVCVRESPYTQRILVEQRHDRWRQWSRHESRLVALLRSARVGRTFEMVLNFALQRSKRDAGRSDRAAAARDVQGARAAEKRDRQTRGRAGGAQCEKHSNGREERGAEEEIGGKRARDEASGRGQCDSALECSQAQGNCLTTGMGGRSKEARRKAGAKSTTDRWGAQQRRAGSFGKSNVRKILRF